MYFQSFDKLYLALCIFLFSYMLIIYFKPHIIFDNKNNRLRQFGVGYKNTTVFSLWLVSILLAIVSYFSVIYIYYLKNMWF